MATDGQTIEVNGNQYDAITGQLVGSAKQIAKKVSESNQNRTIDGFVRGSVGHAKKSINSSSTRLHKTAQDIHSRAQSSKTLMRQAVKKPSVTVNKHSDPKIHQSKTTYNQHRAERANKTPRDSRVKRFGIISTYSAPAEKKPVAVDKISPVHTARASAAATARPMPSMVTSASHQQLERLLDQALTNASAHKNHHSGRKADRTGIKGIFGIPKWAAVTGISVLVVAASGFFAWQNVPQVGVKVATLGSSVEATVPSYSPSGFSFEGPMAIDENKVKMEFRSNADPSRWYAVTQQKSDWDSTTLLSNHIEPKAEPFQTAKIKGNTVYIYGKDNNAAWVSGGKLYTIEDQANLNSEQLLKIAEGL